ncbi:hypothetical protein [Pedobacter psychrophilus]|uniref:hypothetical protein n=1 Tax=Pedobacter psychrophilus TaxID=1826909 RepID=UPI000B11BEC9|nr:hypothetical protein [Pedobacter psychrophilus]
MQKIIYLKKMRESLILVKSVVLASCFRAVALLSNPAKLILTLVFGFMSNYHGIRE